MTSLTFTWLNNREINRQKDKLANGQMDKQTHLQKDTPREKRETERWMNGQTQTDGPTQRLLPD